MAPAAARGLLRPFGWVYGRVMAARNRSYEAFPSRTRSAPVPVVSVGNITVGGTGKTPVVRWIADRLADMGRKPATLSRGYAGSTDGNDETRMLNEARPGLAQVVDADRARGAQAAAQRGADCVVLDDGFQHRRLRRDLDIVLVDALAPFGGGRVFPAGRLREPAAGLKRAGAVVLTRADLIDAQRLSAIKEEVARLAPKATVAVSAFRATRLADLRGAADREASWIAGRRIFAFCGVGNPQGFVAMLRSLGPDRLDAVFFKDHTGYTAERVRSLTERAAAAGAEAIVSTRKDAVKIPHWPGGLPAFALDIELDILKGREALEERIAAIL